VVVNFRDKSNTQNKSHMGAMARFLIVSDQSKATLLKTNHPPLFDFPCNFKTHIPEKRDLPGGVGSTA
jgi:hypothetical protein